MFKEITDSDFSGTLSKAAVPVLVAFWAHWRGSCRAGAPVLEELATECAGKLKIHKLNVDDNPSIPEKFQIRSIPTPILFKDSEPVERITGALPKSQIQSLPNKARG